MSGVVIGDAKHFVTQDQPDAVAREILLFLDDAVPATGDGSGR